MPALPLIVGLGSPQGDDRAGWVVVERLWECGCPEEAARRARHPADLLDWADPGRPLIVCDACHDGRPPGTLGVWTWPKDEQRFAAAEVRGSHDLPLACILRQGVQLGLSPTHVAIRTVSGAAWSPGTDPDPAVVHAARSLADRLWRELRTPMTAEVLLLSEDLMVVAAVRSAVERQGWRIAVAASLDEAAAARPHDAPRVVLLDLGLPGVDVADVVRRAGGPVIAFGPHVAAERLAAASAAGCAQVVSRGRFLSSIGALLQQQVSPPA